MAIDPTVPNPSPPPAGRKFPCSACGARLDFDPAAKALKCPYCGTTEEIQPAETEVKELDYEATLARLTDRAGQSTIAGRSSEVRCDGCGANVLLDDRLVTESCPFCGTFIKNEPHAAETMILPESLLPFEVDRRKAIAAFNRWIESLWFAPNALKQLANLGRLNGVYVPYWTYDAMTYSRYQGRRGDNYTVTETYTDRDSNGQTVVRTRSVVRTRWTPVSGRVEHFFNDVLICGSRSLPPHLIAGLEPWDLGKLTGFAPQYLSGFQTERYAVGLKEGFEVAQAKMAEMIRELCRADIGGDQQDVQFVRTKYTDTTYKHLLLPVWLATYRYHDRPFRILVNARTGRVSGDRPYSWVKIAFAVAMGLAVLGGTVGLALALRG